MIKLLPLFVILVFISISQDCYGKTSTIIAYEVGPTKDDISFFNPQHNVNFYNDPTGVPGLVVTQQLYKSLYFETGVYSEYIGLNMVLLQPEDTTNLIFAQEEIQIPLRLQLRQYFFNGRLDFFMSAGAMIVIGKDGWSYLYTKNNNTVLTIDKYINKNNYALIEFGVGADLFITKNFFVGIKYRYNAGISPKLDMEYHTQGLEQNNRTDYYIKSNGNYHSFMTSIGYRINWQWNKKKK